MTPHAVLEKYFGFREFLDAQEEVITAIASGADALVVMPTGGGKSLCYQLPALLLEGTTVVVSPLIALMKDQVDALQRRGISATLINSSLSPAEQRERIRALARGEFKLVYIAPERFRSRSFLEALGKAQLRSLRSTKRIVSQCGAMIFGPTTSGSIKCSKRLAALRWRLSLRQQRPKCAVIS